MGHTMVRGPGYLLVYGGYSLVHGLLNDLLSFNLSTNTWSHVEVNQVPSRVPGGRFLHSAVLFAVSKFNRNFQYKESRFYYQLPINQCNVGQLWFT